MIIATQNPALEILKHRLLLRRLDEMPETETHAVIIREANQAAAWAARTPFPLLTFPCLFEERACTAVERFSKQARSYWRGMEFTAPALAYG